MNKSISKKLRCVSIFSTPKMLRYFEISPMWDDLLLLKPSDVKIHVRRAASQRYSYFLLYMCLCIYLFVCVTLLTKRKTIQYWNLVHTFSRLHLKTGFLIFRKSDPEGSQPQKTAMSCGFAAYLPDFFW